ncbi:MAG: hypothetical protein SGI83_07550, partial [Bacteroidota bacterium]|nr:hypothetical protein [Bacteroidota bacterium]
PPPPPPPGPLFPPIALAGPDLRIRDIGFMWLVGTYTHYTNPPSTATWRKITGPDCLINTPDAYITQVSSFTPGVYTFELTARSLDGLTGKDTVIIEVENLPSRILAFNTVQGLSGPNGDFITIPLNAEVFNEIDYVMVKEVERGGVVHNWEPVVFNFPPANFPNTGTGYWYTKDLINEISIVGQIRFSGQYDVRIYY